VPIPDAASPAPGTEKPRHHTAIFRIMAILIVVAISIFVFIIRDRVEEFAVLGYPGAFLIALLANATVLLPAPGVALIFALGNILHPLPVGLAAGLGGALGELSGYLAGFSGQAIVERAHVYRRILPWIEKYGGWAVLVLSAVPNPFFDLAGVAAGVTRMPMAKFLFFCWIGQTIKMLLFAFAGAYSLGWVSNILP
jgi:membrane protein DedA with SNARE-associated domain